MISTNASSNKIGVFLFISVIINVFLLAFMLGRETHPGMMPPHHMGEMRSGFMDNPHDFHHDQSFNPGPPPSLFSPQDLFTPDEMRENAQLMRSNFSKAQSLREDFARHLQKESLTKEQVLKHLDAVQALIDEVINNIQDQAAEKISKMSPEERQRFAQKLLEPASAHQGPPPFDVPPEDR